MALQRFLMLFFWSCKLFVTCSKLEDYVIKENDSWIFKNIAQCLSEVAELSTSKNQDVIVIFKEAHNEDAVLISTKYPIVILTEKVLTRKLQHGRQRAVAYVFSPQNITEILSFIFWDMQTKFIVVCPNEKEAENNFAQFWDQRSVHVLALIYNSNHSNIHLLTYFPYNDDHCEKLHKPVRLAVWNPTSGIGVHLFPPKVNDFRKCPLYVTLLERPPSVFEGKDGHISGVEVYILYLVADAINATPIFQLLHKKKTVYKSRGNQLMLELIENHSHVVAGSLLMTTSVSSLSEGIEYSASMCITIAVPKLKKQSYFYIFSRLLTGRFFLLTTCIILAYIIFFYIFYKIKDKTLTFPKACWIIVSPIIGGHRVEVKYFTSRILFVTWLFTAFVFCKFFEASISSSVLAPEEMKQLENIFDVFRSTLTLRGENFLMREVVPRYLPENHTAVVDFRPIHEELAMEVIVKYKNLAFLGSEMNLLYTFLSKKEFEDHVYIQEECVTSYSPVIQIRKNSPLYHVFRKYITTLSETGMIKNAIETILVNFYKRNNDEKIKTSAPALTLQQIFGAFVVFTMGLIISFVCFTTELLYWYLKGGKIGGIEKRVKGTEFIFFRKFVAKRAVDSKWNLRN